ncbi:hypothetical protein RRF57_012945 [Xylaria bambusicola]|uniref:Uncharacterized protein n=1 Tax=Xylaria bambusicola TaxID=326684 RepID=A0AAN7V087_9PEZI
MHDSPRTASHLESGNADNTKSEAKGEGNQKSLDGEYPLHIKIDDILSDTQSDIEIPASSELVAESQGRDCGRVIPSLPERRAKARQRLLQSKAYAELIEDRIQDLEQKYRVISKKLNVNTGTSKYINYLAENTQSIPKISKMGWVDFTHRLTINPGTLTGAWKHRPEVNEKPTAAIELLVEQPVPDPNHTRYRSSNSLLPACLRFDLAIALPSPIKSGSESKPLLKILSHITGCGVAIGPHQHRLLMMRPFKLLVYFEKDIKNYLRIAKRD